MVPRTAGRIGAGRRSDAEVGGAGTASVGTGGSAKTLTVPTSMKRSVIGRSCIAVLVSGFRTGGGSLNRIPKVENRHVPFIGILGRDVSEYEPCE